MERKGRDTMFCRRCGKEIPDGAKFCKYCGTPADSQPPAPQAPVYAPAPQPAGGGKKSSVIISCILIVLLLAVIVVLLIVFRDYLFGVKETKIEDIENETVFVEALEERETHAEDLETEETGETDRLDEPPTDSEATAAPENTEDISEPRESSELSGIPENSDEPDESVAASENSGTVQAPVQPESDFAPAFWQRDWYGVLQITNATGEKYRDGTDDFFMRIHPDNDNLIMWNLYTGPSGAIIHAKYHLQKGAGPRGSLYTTETWFSGNTDLFFEVDPATGLSAECENLICLSGYFSDEEGSFNFTFYMKPWGEKNWDDVAAINPAARPKYCEQIYFPLMDNQEPMPRSFEAYR